MGEQVNNCNENIKGGQLVVRVGGDPTTTTTTTTTTTPFTLRTWHFKISSLNAQL
jgi:hypothetical protein